MGIRWSKHKHDIKHRPTHENHDLENDLEVYILDHGIPLFAERERLEDRYICQLQTHQSNKGGMNTDVHAYAKEVYKLWSEAFGPKSPQV